MLQYEFLRHINRQYTIRYLILTEKYNEWCTNYWIRNGYNKGAKLVETSKYHHQKSSYQHNTSAANLHVI